jgi:hypothetical protein
LKGFYRLINHDSVSSEGIINAYRKGLTNWSLDLPEGRKDTYFYLFQDSTYGKYPGRKVDLGYLQTGTDNGVVIHNGILTDSNYLPLGLPIQQFIQRDRVDFGKKHKRATRPFDHKESHKWIEAIDFARKFERKTGISIVQVADKESDVAEVMNYALQHRQLFIFNGTHDRSIQNQSTTLKKHFESIAHQGIVKRPILDSKGKEHLCNCEIRFEKLLLEGITKPITVVHLTQIEAIEGQELTQWMLLTNIPVKGLEQAIEVINSYARRWTTCEDFHKCLKTGCNIQARQLQSAQALFSAIALLSLVAISLLRMRHLSQYQKDSPLNEFLSEDEIQLANLMADKYLMPIDLTLCQKNTTLWFVLLIARMGGHQGFKQSGMPGWQTIWKGWNSFHSTVIGFSMSKNLFSQKHPTYG